ncbi:myelin-oligodendrocyte glycoprotein-like [Hoplias malabaricus]|uniref:myelin-oligodendrocyte glycoprotein-like n=1 Tax=Hoplias malabaricus TaxID=27720 RepID=UPI0034630610
MILCVTLLILSGSVSVAERFKVIGPEEAVVADIDEDVVLPCSLKPTTSAENMMVSWFKKDVIVHHYENHKDRNDVQSESYRGRIDLFKEELKNGNISLKLSAVQLSDEGTYSCLVVSSSGYESATLYLNVRDVPAAWKTALIWILVLLPLLFVLIIFVMIMKSKFIVNISVFTNYVNTQ